jgi:hypothetical protein
VYMAFLSPIRAICPVHYILLDFIIRTTWVSSTDHEAAYCVVSVHTKLLIYVKRTIP